MYTVKQLSDLANVSVRTLHYYVDSQTNARAEIESRLTGWREGRASIKPQLDPAFEHIRHLTQ